MNITIERYEQIEQERQQTLSDPGFQKWMEEMKVSRMFVNNEGKLNARDMMKDWKFDSFIRKKINLNF
jgi:hypothetical protein